MRVRKFGAGRYPAKFSYGYEEISKLLGCSVAAARKHAQRNHFNPNSLPSVLEFVRDRLQKPTPQLVESDSEALIKKIESVNK